ncbi:MAG: hypothetical protein LBV19_02885, partial [Streptococcaceae bacterium]|nr:hypothetical protein [Streptococcaceae bacterium]
NGGVLRLSHAPELGLSKEAVRKMYLRGDLERVHSGVYVMPDDLPDEMVLKQSIYPKGILSHESAARLYGFTTFSPSETIFSFPQGYHFYKDVKMSVSPYFVRKEQYETGITEVTTWEGNLVRAYNQEKTIIDLALSKYTLPLIFKEVVEGYLAVGTVNVERLIRYSKQFNVEEKIKKEVLVYT